MCWDKRYKTKGYICGTRTVKFLKENIGLLPKGKALVLAMGEGRNAVYLAKNGFEVEGCDISEFAIEKALRLAEKRGGVKLDAFLTDLTRYKIKRDNYDLISVFIISREI